MRTTVDIDDPILKELKALQKKQGKSLGRLISDLLAHALKANKVPKKNTRACWISKSMSARVDLADKEAVYTAMDR